MSERKTLFEKFEIIETLKKDSQTGVYLANHIFLNKEIILKSLNTSNLTDEIILHRFKREAKILARLDHPNIIKVLDFGTFQNQFYISFEYFEGKSLREFLKKKKLDLNEFEKIVSQILSGLDYAHSNKIIHRDLKPENILIDSNLNVKIADFGLALSEDEVQVTQKESIVGTPSYMSPEQIRGEELTPSSDIFSLGIILFEMLTGVNPFVGKDIAETINNILFFEKETILIKLESIPEKWKNIILRCLEKSIEKRYNSVKEILYESDLQAESFPIKTEKEKFELIFSTPVILSTVLILISIIALILFFENSRKDFSTQISQTQNSDINITDTPHKSIPDKTIEQSSDDIKNKEVQNTKETKIPQKVSEINQPNIMTADSAGELFITCSPWADIYINDLKVETTPLKEPIKLKTGKYQLKLIHPNFPPIERLIEIQADKLSRLDFNFYDNFSYIQFQIIPWGEIKINDQNVGTTPLPGHVILKPGKQILNIFNPNFGSFVDTILIQKGETLVYRLNFNHIKNWHNN